MLNCHDATRLMSEAQDRPLKLSERISLKMHVMMCSGCNNFKSQMGTLRMMTRSYSKNKNDSESPK